MFDGDIDAFDHLLDMTQHILLQSPHGGLRESLAGNAALSRMMCFLGREQSADSMRRSSEAFVKFTVSVSLVRIPTESSQRDFWA